MDTLLTVTQRLPLQRVAGEAQHREAIFTAWGKRLPMRASDQLQLAISRAAGEISTVVQARWIVRQVTHPDGVPWSVGNIFTADGLSWTVGGVQAPRTAGGFVELYCEADSRSQ